MGTWERKSLTFWMYHLEGSALIYGYVVRRQPSDAAAARWDALLASPAGKGDVTIRAGVSLGDAKEAVEQTATATARRWRADRRGRDAIYRDAGGAHPSSHDASPASHHML